MLKSLLAAAVIVTLLGLTSASAQPGYYGQPRFYDYGQYGDHTYGYGYGYGYGYSGGYGYGYGYSLVVPRVGVYRGHYRRAYRRW